MALPEVISLGTMLVEVMRVDLDAPLDRPGAFVGPYPSGDTPIYIDSVARLGRQAGFIGCVGRDAFGRCLLDRLAGDGVDLSQVRELAGHTTGVAFVAYFADGSRAFLYHWRHAAAGQLGPDMVDDAYFANCRWLHLTGCTLAVNDASRDACYRALRGLPPGARVSFDPNLRPEVLSVEQIRDLCRPALERADVFLPSAGEAMLFTGAASDEEGCRLLAAQGKLVALKLGAQGCRLFSGEQDLRIPSFPVVEVDPTGAGDTFSAALTVALLEGLPLEQAGRFANAAGALAVTKKGPMEGAPTRAEVVRLLAERNQP